MTAPSHARTKIAAFLAILTLSALIMVWLFWRFPVITAVATVAILLALGVSARLARLIDTDLTEMQRDKQSV